MRIETSVTYAFAATAATLTPCASAQTSISSGVPFHRGEPFFGIGYYDADAQPGEEKRESIRLLGDAGFNVMLLLQREETEESFPALFDFADRHGVGLIPLADVGHEEWGSYHAERFSYIKDHPTLLYANVADDCYNGYNTTEHVERAAEALRELAPAVPVLASGNTSNFFYGDLGRYPENFMGIVDVFENQAYTISKRSRDAEDVLGAKGVYEIMETAVEQAGEEVPMFGVIQTFNYGQIGFPERGQRMPTGAETELGAWLAVMAGSKGVHFYCLREQEGRQTPLADASPEHRAIWDASRRFARDVRGGLDEVFLWGLHQSERLAEDLFVANWEHEGETYLAVANSGSTSQEVRFEVPTAAGGSELRSHFDRHARTLDWDDGVLSGRIGGEQFHLYVLDAAPRENLLPGGGFVADAEVGGWIVGEASDAGFSWAKGGSPAGGAVLETNGGGRGYLYRVIEGLPDGTYAVRAAASADPRSRSRLIVKRHGGEERSARAAGTRKGRLEGTTLRDVEVTSGTLEIGYLVDDSGTWSQLADVEVVRLDTP